MQQFSELQNKWNEAQRTIAELKEKERRAVDDTATCLASLEKPFQDMRTMLEDELAAEPEEGLPPPPNMSPPWSGSNI